MSTLRSAPIIENRHLASPATAGGEQLTVLSANLQNPFARLFPGRREALLARLEAFAQLVEAAGAGILLCQEVGRSRGFRVDSWITDRLGMAYVYTRANGDARRWGREEGLAIFSRYPLERPIVTLLDGGLWQRPALGVVARTPLGEIAVYTAHLSLRPWRNRQQPERLRVWVEATAGDLPAIISGDFNAHETASQMKALQRAWVDTFRALNPAADGTTHALKLFDRVVRRRRLDYLFLRQSESSIRINEAKHLKSTIRFSDHAAVLAILSR